MDVTPKIKAGKDSQERKFIGRTRTPAGNLRVVLVLYDASNETYVHATGLLPLSILLGNVYLFFATLFIYYYKLSWQLLGVYYI